MAVSKVVYGVDTLIDLTGDTVRADTLRLGYTAHLADGSAVTGTLSSAPIEPYVEEYNIGYVDGARWIYENPTRTYTDIYRVAGGHSYFITLGARVGSRFRSIFTTQDITLIDHAGSVQGTAVITRNNPPEYTNVLFTAPEDGYLIVAKDNVGVTGIKTYVYDREGWQ